MTNLIIKAIFAIVLAAANICARDCDGALSSLPAGGVPVPAAEPAAPGHWNQGSEASVRTYRFMSSQMGFKRPAFEQAWNTPLNLLNFAVWDGVMGIPHRPDISATRQTAENFATELYANGAAPEAKYNGRSAFAAVYNIMRSRGATLADLALAVDTVYRFKSEK